VSAPVVLYRCRTPTNWLCPCGRVARELRRRDVAANVVRVSWRGRDRIEVEELSGQRKVPALAIDDQVIVDSRRIVEYLEFRSA